VDDIINKLNKTSRGIKLEYRGITLHYMIKG